VAGVGAPSATPRAKRADRFERDLISHARIQHYRDCDDDAARRIGECANLPAIEIFKAGPD
jgi:hypothetical protein